VSDELFKLALLTLTALHVLTQAGRLIFDYRRDRRDDPFHGQRTIKLLMNTIRHLRKEQP
jgi:hypothetical protein